MKSIIQKWGNSQGVRLDKKRLDEMNLSINEDVLIDYQKDYIIIRKNNSTDSINNLFKNYISDNDSVELLLEDDEIVGNEIW